ncbi:MAG: hypothetical protein D6826_02505 [Alphaproteobacteria bacterium]|nr:MAG: hypothetical protein D6826_02505 [Alphaproteobacteria bacterium]
MREPLKLRLEVPPAALPVALGEVRAHLRLDDDQVLEDALLLGMVRVATDACEAFTRRALMTRTWTLVRDRWPDEDTGVVTLPRPPLQSVVDVRTIDEAGTQTVWSASNYVVDTAAVPGRLIAHAGRAFPHPGRRGAGIEIRFVAGYGDAPGDVPAPLRDGILRFVTWIFEHRGDAVVPTAGVDAARASGAAALWRPFIVPRL